MDKEFPDDIRIYSNHAAAKILQISKETLRIYSKEGLLFPSGCFEKEEFYTLSDIKKGTFIRYLVKKVKVSLLGVKIIFRLLNRLKVDPDNYMTYVDELVEDL